MSHRGGSWDEAVQVPGLAGGVEFWGTPIVYPTPSGFALCQIRWWYNRKHGKVGYVPIRRYGFKTWEAARASADRLLAQEREAAARRPA